MPGPYLHVALVHRGSCKHTGVVSEVCWRSGPLVTREVGKVTRDMEWVQLLGGGKSILADGA